MAQKASEFYEENVVDGSAILIGQGNANFLWLEKMDEKLLLCDFDGLVSDDPAEFDVEEIVVDWLNQIHAEPSSAKDVTFFTPVYRNGRFEIK